MKLLRHGQSQMYCACISSMFSNLGRTILRLEMPYRLLSHLQFSLPLLPTVFQILSLELCSKPLVASFSLQNIDRTMLNTYCGLLLILLKFIHVHTQCDEQLLCSRNNGKFSFNRHNRCLHMSIYVFISQNKVWESQYCC